MLILESDGAQLINSILDCLFVNVLLSGYHTFISLYFFCGMALLKQRVSVKTKQRRNL